MEMGHFHPHSDRSSRMRELNRFAFRHDLPISRSQPQDAPPELYPGALLRIDDPAHPLFGQTFPIVRLSRFEGHWAPIVRLPSGTDLRVVLQVPATLPQARGAEGARPDLGLLLERRQWIQSKIADVRNLEDSRQGDSAKDKK